MKKKFKIFLKSNKSKNYLITIAIGKKYFSSWKKYSLKNWMYYCKKNSLGLIVITDHLIDKNNKFWKKPTWQKFLIANYFYKLREKIIINNICYIDTDFFISPIAPNIFNFMNKKKISVISMRNRLPYPYLEVRKKIAYYRKKFYSKKYPLDSSLFISLKDLYKHHDLAVQKDEACAGLFIFNLKKFQKKFKEWFYLYEKDVYSITNSGDQTHFNFHIQNERLDHWIDYKFQTSWLYEMAWNYPFLYEKKNLHQFAHLIIESTLLKCHFLHFAGTWPESNFWRTDKLFNKKNKINLFNNLNKYLKMKVRGKPVGMKKFNS